MKEIPGHKWQGEFHAAEEKDEAEMGEVENSMRVCSDDGFVNRLGSRSLCGWASASCQTLASPRALRACSFSVGLEEAIAIGVAVRFVFVV